MRSPSERAERRFVAQMRRDLLIAEALGELRKQILQQIKGALAGLSVLDDPFYSKKGQTKVEVPGRAACISVPIDSFLSRRNGKDYVDHKLINDALKRLSEMGILRQISPNTFKEISLPSSRFALRSNARNDGTLHFHIGLVEGVQSMSEILRVLKRLVFLPEEISLVDTHVLWRVDHVPGKKRPIIVPSVFQDIPHPMYQYVFDIPEATKGSSFEEIFEKIRRKLGMNRILRMIAPPGVRSISLAAKKSHVPPRKRSK